MMYIVPCVTCKHHRKKATCDAFPERIPEEIILTSNVHSRPLKGQGNKIVYEPKMEVKI